MGEEYNVRLLSGGELTLKKADDSPSQFNVKKNFRSLNRYESIALSMNQCHQQTLSLQTCWQSQDFIESVRLLTAHGNKLEDQQSWVV